jgi:hypothetical protein
MFLIDEIGQTTGMARRITKVYGIGSGTEADIVHDNGFELTIGRLVVDAIDVKLALFLLELNDFSTRAIVKVTVEKVFREFNDIVAKVFRGFNDIIYEFSVICDSTNNTPDRIARNELWIDCYFRVTAESESIHIPVKFPFYECWQEFA